MEDNKKELNVMLDDAIRDGIESLGGATMTEYPDRVDAVVKLYKLRLEEIENERSFMAKSDETVDKERDFQLRQEQISGEKSSRKLRFIADALGIAVPAVVYVLCFRRGLKFESEGTFTSQTVRGLLSKLKIH